jgi:hypothetical protein
MISRGEYAAAFDLPAATLGAMSLRARWLATTVWLWLSAGCATAPAPAGETVEIDPHAMYPLEEGNAWSYDIDTGQAATTLAITRVEKRSGSEAHVRTGRKLVFYELVPEGIRLARGGAWLLRTPFELGAKWDAPGGRAARIVAVDRLAQTHAGTFDGCIEVLETGGELDLEVRTVYCPGVGPVSVASTMRSNVSERSLTVTAKLRGYQVSP